METIQRRKEGKLNYVYYFLFFFWIIFLLCRVVFLFTQIFIQDMHSTKSNLTFEFYPILDHFKIVLSIFVYRYQWFNSLFYIKPITLKSFSPDSKINAIQYSNSLIALESGYKGIYTHNCIGDQALHIAVSCRVDEMLSHFYHFDYAPWLLISTNELYFSENKLLNLLDYLESEFNPMAENILLGNFNNKSIILESGVIFSRALVKLIVDSKYSFYSQAESKMKPFVLSLYEFLKYHKEKVHVFKNPFSFFSYPNRETWNQTVFEAKNKKNLKKILSRCPNISQLSQKVNQSVKFVRISAKDTVSLYMNQAFDNETVVLAKDLPNLPNQIKFIQILSPKFSSFLCFDEDNNDDIEFKKENVLNNEVRF